MDTTCPRTAGRSDLYLDLDLKSKIPVGTLNHEFLCDGVLWRSPSGIQMPFVTCLDQIS